MADDPLIEGQRRSPSKQLRLSGNRTEDGTVEIWCNLGDLVDWLETFSEVARSPQHADAALDIRAVLIDSVKRAGEQAEQDGQDDVEEAFLPYLG